MQNVKHTRNKLIVLARKVCDIQGDQDLSFRSLAKMFNIGSGTVQEINDRWKDRYDFGVAFEDPKEKKKDIKLSTGKARQV